MESRLHSVASHIERYSQIACQYYAHTHQKKITLNSTVDLMHPQSYLLYHKHVLEPYSAVLHNKDPRTRVATFLHLHSTLKNMWGEMRFCIFTFISSLSCLRALWLATPTSLPLLLIFLLLYHKLPKICPL